MPYYLNRKCHLVCVKYGMRLNRYGDGALSAHQNVTLWSDSTADDQVWLLREAGQGLSIRTALNTDWGLNIWRGSDNFNNCDVYPVAGNETDSTVDFRTVNNDLSQYRIKLMNYDLYLTAKGGANGSDVRWEAYTGGDEQLWQVRDYIPGGSSGGVGGGTGEHGNYVYPTVQRTCSQGYSSTHPALDILDGAGDNGVYAIADGYVAFAQSCAGSWMPGSSMDGTMESMGNCVAINHVNPFNNRSGAYARTVYMHMKNSPSVKPGQFVSKGQKLGDIGKTGVATGEHLHFSVSVGDYATMRPGAEGWIGISSLPDFDPRICFGQYHF